MKNANLQSSLLNNTWKKVAAPAVIMTTLAGCAGPQVNVVIVQPTDRTDGSALNIGEIASTTVTSRVLTDVEAGRFKPEQEAFANDGLIFTGKGDSNFDQTAGTSTLTNHAPKAQPLIGDIVCDPSRGQMPVDSSSAPNLKGQKCELEIPKTMWNPQDGYTAILSGKMHCGNSGEILSIAQVGSEKSSGNTAAYSVLSIDNSSDGLQATVCQVAQLGTLGNSPDFREVQSNVAFVLTTRLQPDSGALENFLIVQPENGEPIRLFTPEGDRAPNYIAYSTTTSNSVEYTSDNAWHLYLGGNGPHEAADFSLSSFAFYGKALPEQAAHQEAAYAAVQAGFNPDFLIKKVFNPYSYNSPDVPQSEIDSDPHLAAPTASEMDDMCAIAGKDPGSFCFNYQEVDNGNHTLRASVTDTNGLNSGYGTHEINIHDTDELFTDRTKGFNPVAFYSNFPPYMNKGENDFNFDTHEWKNQVVGADSDNPLVPYSAYKRPSQGEINSLPAVTFAPDVNQTDGTVTYNKFLMTQRALDNPVNCFDDDGCSAFLSFQIDKNASAQGSSQYNVLLANGYYNAVTGEKYDFAVLQSNNIAGESPTDIHVNALGATGGVIHTDGKPGVLALTVCPDGTGKYSMTGTYNGHPIPSRTNLDPTKFQYTTGAGKDGRLTIAAQYNAATSTPSAYAVGLTVYSAAAFGACIKSDKTASLSQRSDALMNLPSMQ